MEEVKLIKLTKEYEKELGEMIEEFKYDQRVNHSDRSPWAIFRNDYHDFDNYLNNLENKGYENGRVPDSVWFMLEVNTNKLVGAVNIRHELNEGLLFDGGHIGDGIRPSARHKGYGTKIIALALEKCKELGIDKVLITCNKDNVGSRKTILNNNGIKENEVIDSDGFIVERYWITLN